MNKTILKAIETIPSIGLKKLVTNSGTPKNAPVIFVCGMIKRYTPDTNRIKLKNKFISFTFITLIIR